MDESVSTNTIDQLVGHTNGPTEPVVDRDLTRSRSSAYIVHGNFNRLATMCDDITTTGCIVAERDTARTDVENEVYRRVHNYVSSLYSYNEQIRAILDGRLDESIDKGYFSRTRRRRGPGVRSTGHFLVGPAKRLSARRLLVSLRRARRVERRRELLSSVLRETVLRGDRER
jgi:hypothetical protein